MEGSKHLKVAAIRLAHLETLLQSGNFMDHLDGVGVYYNFHLIDTDDTDTSEKERVEFIHKTMALCGLTMFGHASGKLGHGSFTVVLLSEEGDDENVAKKAILCANEVLIKERIKAAAAAGVAASVIQDALNAAAIEGVHNA